MKDIAFRHNAGPVDLLYLQDDQGHMGFLIVPTGLDLPFADKKEFVDPLVQVHIRGDMLPGAYMNGHSLSGSLSAMRFRFVLQESEAGKVVTTLEDGQGHKLRHIVSWKDGWEGITIRSEFINENDAPVVLEDLSSFCLSGLTPYVEGDACGCLTRHVFKSFWSAEGRLVSDPLERLNMEPSWSLHGVRLEKIGQVGSMPVRGYFPFEAVEDTKNHVVWAAQLAINSTWQMELRRKDESLSLNGGLGDYDFGHWAKEVKPGESFLSPEAYLTVVAGDLTDATQALLTIQKGRNTLMPDTLPLLFNEYCTTWGVPSEENLSSIIEKLQGKGFDGLVIDAGWFREGDALWFENGGDWNVCPELFPNGLKSVTDRIHAAGMRAGLWFEWENIGSKAHVREKTEWMLKRDGYTLVESGKTYLDLRNPEVIAYLDQNVIGRMQECGIDYIKVDYNGTIGIGCDGAESLGEGLRQNMEATKKFFRRMREQIPGLMIENCSSGGHRLEPSMMEVSTMASFSDAHECPEIPVIAANLHHLILPGQSQIWAVMRGSDSLKRITYSLTAAMLGVMCLSGEIYDLDEAQQAQVDLGTAFYKKVSPIIRDGRSRIYREGIESYRHLTGWQAVCRTADTGDKILVVAHSFGLDAPADIVIPVPEGFQIADQYSDGTCTVATTADGLKIRIPEDFTGLAVLLEK